MARLAAYYQEDFHYPNPGYGPKQRKSAYLVYEEPKNNLFKSHFANGNRIRSLAASEPTLAPNFTPEHDMTLKQRHLMYGSQLIDSPHSSTQHFDNSCNTPSHLARYDPCAFDNVSLSSFSKIPAYDNRYIHRLRPSHKDRTLKRFSYAEPSNSYVSGELHSHQNFSGHQAHIPLHEVDFINYNRHLQPDNYYLEPSEHDLSHPILHRLESRQGKWHWMAPNTSFLSPPSPLDSGLSSQSITSSPSLEAEPVTFPGDAFRTERHPGCLCPKAAYPVPRNHLPHMNRSDSGRMSPGISSVLSHALPNRTNRIPNAGRAMSYTGDDFDNIGQQLSQVRYGKLGIVGEPTDVEQISGPKKHPDNYHRQNYTPINRENEISYVYSEENRIPSEKLHRRKHKLVPNYTRPCVIIIESPEKYGDSDNASSPERDPSDKSQGPESPMSVTVSNSDSPSVSSSNNDLDDRRKTTEREIRELEDMYKKCNLNDRDLLDRAERRDLPTPHQEKVIGNRLMRSNSDTLYERTNPAFLNPYEPPRRAPPLRRSGLPDRIADDMALRKLQKSTTHSGFNPAENTITYMLCSTQFTPTVPAGKDILMQDYPDVELDDFSYRKHYFGKKSKIVDPQPPFGIPLRPPPPQKVYSDYLHAVPSSAPQPLCHPRGNPDVVRDDMAFRTLRKEEPERMYYDISQVYRKCRG